MDALSRIKTLRRSKGEQFLILDIYPSSIDTVAGTGAAIRGVLLTVDEDRRIAPVKMWEHFPARRSMRTLPPRVALAFHHSLLFTKEVPLTLDRERELWNIPLDAIEIENAAAQTIGKSFQEYRREAAKFLGVNELDAALVNNVLDNFLIDGKSADTLGTPRAKKIKATLRLQFTSRELFEALKDAWNTEGGFSLIAREEEMLRALARQYPRVSHLLVLEAHADGRDTATLFGAPAKEKGLARMPLVWSGGAIRSRISNMTGADARTADELYHAYLAGEMSPRASRAVKTAIAPALRSLQSEIALAAKPRALVASPAGELPPDVRTHCSDFPAAAAGLAGAFGFSIDPAEWRLPPHEVFGTLAAFLAHYFDKSDHALNQRLQRRVHWLSPAPV